jgi:hypothetical protein
MVTLAKIKDAIRSKYAWPGGYPLYLILTDGEALSIDSARENWRAICAGHIPSFEGPWKSDWHVAAIEVNWEKPDLYCVHSGERIVSAYAEEDQ